MDVQLIRPTWHCTTLLGPILTISTRGPLVPNGGGLLNAGVDVGVIVAVRMLGVRVAVASPNRIVLLVPSVIPVWMGVGWGA
jgi:hypothetical protein